MASPLPTSDKVPIPVDASLAGETQASAARFPTSLLLTEQATTHSVVLSIAGDIQVSAAGFPTYLPLAEHATTHSLTCMMEAQQFGPWSDLPPELLSLVLKRLPSLADRVRLRAVCHPWRSNSVSVSLPLPFPWLTLPDGTFLSIPGGEIHRMPVPDGASCHGSIDNWLFLMNTDGACSLLNPFSQTTLELPNLVTVWQSEIDLHAGYPLSYKLVAPSPLESSPESLVAALILDHVYSEYLCIFKQQVATFLFRGNQGPLPLMDFAFFDGRLYFVSEFHKLFVVDFGEDLVGPPNINCLIDSNGPFLAPPKYLDPKGYYDPKQYLVECGGKLLMVQRFMRSTGCFGGNLATVGFTVLEVDMRTNPGEWRMVGDLGGYSLFLGRHSSKSLPAGECSGSQEEDCIYFICDYPCPESSANPLHDSGIYNVRSGTFKPLHSGTPAVAQHQDGQWGLTWFFPPEAV